MTGSRGACPARPAANTFRCPARGAGPAATGGFAYRGRVVARVSNFRRPVAVLAFLLTAVVGLAADLVTKHIAFDRLVELEVRTARGIEVVPREVEVVPGLLHLTAVTNHGAALGLGQGMRPVFIAVSVAAVGLLVWFFANSGRRIGYQVVLGLLLAGVLGNLYDRAVFGHVRDMIYALPAWRWSDLWAGLPGRQVFPWVFNLADVWLCVGVTIMFVWYGMIAKDDPAAQTADDAAEPAGAA